MLVQPEFFASVTMGAVWLDSTFGVYEEEVSFVDNRCLSDNSDVATLMMSDDVLLSADETSLMLYLLRNLETKHAKEENTNKV